MRGMIREFPRTFDGLFSAYAGDVARYGAMDWDEFNCETARFARLTGIGCDVALGEHLWQRAARGSIEAAAILMVLSYSTQGDAARRAYTGYAADALLAIASFVSAISPIVALRIAMMIKQGATAFASARRKTGQDDVLDVVDAELRAMADQINRGSNIVAMPPRRSSSNHPTGGDAA